MGSATIAIRRDDLTSMKTSPAVTGLNEASAVHTSTKRYFLCVAVGPLAANLRRLSFVLFPMREGLHIHVVRGTVD